jgi:hypothetical protein
VAEPPSRIESESEGDDRLRQVLTPAQAFDIGVGLHRQGRVGEAERVYRAMDKDPRPRFADPFCVIVEKKSQRLKPLAPPAAKPAVN